MSETKQNTVERQPYVLEVEPMDFVADAEVKITTSNELCKLTNEYFRAAFADYEGCKFEMSSGYPTLTLVFNHCEHKEGNVYACEMSSGKTVGNSVIDRSRAYDRLAKEGDRYLITEDGKDIIKPLLAPRYANNGNPQWGNIVAETSERQMYGPGVQFTRVIGIDPKAICALIYGKKEDGSWLDYAVEVKADLSARNGFGISASNYVLYITKAYDEHIKKTYEALGFGSAVNSDIIR